MLAKEYNSKGYGKSFPTVQQLATHSRYCADAKALREGEQEPTEVEQKREKAPYLPYRDGEGEPNEIMRHILSTFPGVNNAIVEAGMSWADLWGARAQGGNVNVEKGEGTS